MIDLPAIVIQIEAGFGHASGLLLSSSGHPLHPLPTTGPSSSSSGTIVLPDPNNESLQPGWMAPHDPSRYQDIDDRPMEDIEGLNGVLEEINNQDLICSDCKGKGKIELLTRTVECKKCNGGKA